MLDKREAKIRELKERRKRVRRNRVILALFSVFLFIFLCSKVISFFQKTAVVELSAANVDIMMGEELPSFQAEVKISEDEDAVLDKKNNYTAMDFVNDLKSGKGYVLKSKADPHVEGSYQIKVELDNEIAEKIEKDWKRHIEFSVKNGKCKVKNPVGTWDGEKFKKYDGSYVQSAFVESKAKMYYFGEDGVKVTGWQTVDNKTYYFDKNGVMQKSKWKKRGDDKYYLSKKGAALTGWQKIKKSTYYFDSAGKMATGKVSVGLSLCTFDKNGKLVSQEESAIDPDKPMVALTFDDGPGKRTKEILTQLEKYHAHATFFMLGQKVSSYEDEVKKMKKIGCELGNHSYDHTSLTKLSADGVKEQMDKTNKRIEKFVGHGATVMRPPYGAINDTVKSNVGLPMILWNIDTLDWKTRNVQKTIDTVMKNVGDGDIILLHDIHTESVDATLKLIPMLQEEGYQLVTVSELAAAKGKELENGGKYTDFTK